MKIIFILLLIPIAFFSSAQEKKKVLNEIGFWPGFGYGNNRKSILEGSYQTYYFMGHVGFWPFLKKDFLLEHFQFYLEPQINYVRIVSDSSNKNESEFGMNIGVKYKYALSKKFTLFMYISAGPHSFSATTSRQAPGYVFSDNMGIGAYGHFSPHLAGVFTFRIRHLSNADTRQPNHGINSDNFHLGLSYLF